MARLSLGLCSWDKISWKSFVDLLNPPSDVLLIPFPKGYRNFHANIGRISHIVTHRHFSFLRSFLKYIKWLCIKFARGSYVAKRTTDDYTYTLTSFARFSRCPRNSR